MGSFEFCLIKSTVFLTRSAGSGFWPDGIYTALTDGALKSDLSRRKISGFNMVRKHIKVERQCWYYWADKLNPWCGRTCRVVIPTPAIRARCRLDPNQYITELSRSGADAWEQPRDCDVTLFNESQGQENTSGGAGQTNTANAKVSW